MPGEIENTDERRLTDPVCGMTVTEKSAFHLKLNDKDFYFCSSGCVDKFQNNPDKYLKPKAGQKAGQKTKDSSSCSDKSCAISREIYTCPMHAEVEQQGPGSCPKCGMALEAKGLPVLETKVEYTCPMHPEIVQDHPGSCPKCGMALEPKTVTLQ